MNQFETMIEYNAVKESMGFWGKVLRIFFLSDICTLLKNFT